MKDVYLWKVGNNVVYHTDKLAASQLDGLTREPDKTITEEQFYTAGGLVRIIGDKIFLGKTEAEKAEDKKQAEIQKMKEELKEIDSEAGAGRAVRGAVLASAVKAGVSNEDVSILQELETRANSLRQKISSKK